MQPQKIIDYFGGKCKMQKVIKNRILEVKILWLPFYGKSIQEIADESGQEKYCLGCNKYFDTEWCECGDKREGTERLKDPKARKLFAFLETFTN